MSDDTTRHSGKITGADGSLAGEVEINVEWEHAPIIRHGPDVVAPGRCEVNVRLDPDATSRLLQLPLLAPRPHSTFDVVVNGEAVGVLSDPGRIEWPDDGRYACEGDFAVTNPAWVRKHFGRDEIPTRLRMIMDPRTGTTEVVLVAPP